MHFELAVIRVEFGRKNLGKKMVFIEKTRQNGQEMVQNGAKFTQIVLEICKK